ncbi:MAG: SRPBCC family protein [Planctomycetes bacterium]|nr:SRPBCC family protein [Planctomycetota bacterium]
MRRIRRIRRRGCGEIPSVKFWRLQCSQWLPKPPAEVFPFFADAGNLAELTPPWLSFRILTPRPIPMAEGTLIDYRIGVRGLPMRWRTRIARWQPPHAFADEQLRGPYSLWHHTHTFAAQGGGTLVGDEVRMRPKGGPLAGLLMQLFVRRDVEKIFRYRSAVLRQRFGGGSEPAQLRWSIAEDVVTTATATP